MGASAGLDPGGSRLVWEGASRWEEKWRRGEVEIRGGDEPNMGRSMYTGREFGDPAG
jgi:hypothetical protein